MDTNLLQQIEETFDDRYTNRRWDYSLYDAINKQVPPVLDRYLGTDHPHHELARKTGDTGISLYWVVQAHLVVPMLKYFNHDIHSGSGALCHSDGESGTMVITGSEEEMLFSGSKGFITGGHAAQHLMITGRSRLDGPVDTLVLCKGEHLAGHLAPLHLPALNDVPHATMSLENTVVPGIKSSLDNSALRRALKVSGLMERSAILEVLAGTGLYMAEHYATDLVPQGEDLAKILGEGYENKVRAFMAGARLPETDTTVLTRLKDWLTDVARFTKKYDSSRVRDISFLIKLFPSDQK